MWDFEGEFLVAFAADVASCFALNGYDSWGWVGGGALGAGGYECAKSYQLLNFSNGVVTVLTLVACHPQCSLRGPGSQP